MAHSHFADPRPRREQIAADLRAEILAGQYEGQLPGIIPLQRRFGGSNNTIQAAIAILEEEDLVYREHGKGTFVRDHERFVVTAGAYFDPNESPFTYQLLDVSTVPITAMPRTTEDAPSPEVVPADVAKLLELTPAQSAVRRKRLMLLKDDGSPVELNWSYYPSEIAAGTELAEARRIRGGAPRVLADLGLPQTSSKDRVSTRPPTHEEVKLLRLPQQVSILRTLRVIHSGNTPVEVTIMAKDGHRFELEYSETIQ